MIAIGLGIISQAASGCGSSKGLTVELTSSLSARGITLSSWEVSGSTVRVKLTSAADAKLPGPGEGWFYSQYDKQRMSYGNEIRLPAFKLIQGQTEWFEFSVPDLDRMSKLIVDVHDERFAD
jgi:hypothetical protein